MKILNVAKAALFAIFLHYYCYYVIAGSFIPMGTVAFFAVALLCVGVDVLRQRYLYVGTEVRCWIVYAILAAITSLLVVGNVSFLSDLVKFVQRTLIIMMVAYICEREGSAKFGLQLMAVTAIALAISVFTVLGDIRLKLDITSGANLSDNDTGAIMAFGCFAILFAWGKPGKSTLWLSLLKAAGVIACLCVIFLTGSRKSIIAVVIMAVLLVVLCARDFLRHQRLKGFFVLLAVVAVAVLFISRELLSYAEQTNLYTRLFGRGAEGADSSDEGRVRLILYALEDFANNPLFGLGFAQYTVHHGNYSHCTFVEPLACSGLIGLLYLYPYVRITVKQMQLISHSPAGSPMRKKQKEMFVYLCMGLFIAIGIPYMYKDAPCILLGTLIASQKLSFDEMEHTPPLLGNS